MSGGTPLLTLRQPTPEDCAVLTTLCLRSKAHWGYDAEFMAACTQELSVTPARLADEHHLVAEIAALGPAVGVGALSRAPPAGEPATTREITKLFVDPEAMGQGVGRALVAALMDIAIRYGAERLIVVADPQARPFYERIGFAVTGTEPSGSIPGRLLPRLARDLAAAGGR